MNVEDEAFIVCTDEVRTISSSELLGDRRWQEEQRRSHAKRFADRVLKDTGEGGELTSRKHTPSAISKNINKPAAAQLMAISFLRFVTASSSPHL